jgi:sulfur-oxidizing protein SoxY
MESTSWRRAAGMALALGLVSGAAGAAEEPSPWPDIQAALFEDRPIESGLGVISVEAPARALDAALVPITITAAIPQTPERYITAVTVIVDGNPAPVAGTFHFFPESGSATFTTRVRVDSYTDIRAVAETNDGRLYMATQFVKASGGCSAPMGKDQVAALAEMGRMKLRHEETLALGRPNQVQLLVSHPQNSGMQFDQLSRTYIPAHFVQTIDVRYDGRPVMQVDSDISLSENPSIHFSFVPEASGTMTVEARDNEGGVFREDFPIEVKPGA